MKLVTCLYKGEERVGALTEEGVSFLPYPDMNTLIESLSPAVFAVTSAAKPVPLEEVKLLDLLKHSTHKRTALWR